MRNELINGKNAVQNPRTRLLLCRFRDERFLKPGLVSGERELLLSLIRNFYLPFME